LDETKPQGFIKWSKSFTNTTSASLGMKGLSDTISGMSKMRFSFIETNLSSAAWQNFSTSKQFTLSSAEGLKTVYAQFKDKAGNISIKLSADIIYDKTPPKVKYISSYAISTDESPTEGDFTVNWLGTDKTGIADEVSGIANYIVQQKIDTAAWSTIYPNTKSRTASRQGSFGHTYYYRFQVKDNAGNISSFSRITSTVVPLDQDEMSYSSNWRISNGLSGYFLNTLNLSNSINAFATYTAACKGFYVLGSLAPYMGKVDIYIDNVKVKTVDLYSSSTKKVQQIYVKLWSSSASHTVKLVVTGQKNASSNGTWVDLDGLGVLY
jgi:hypothetical protein